VVCSHARVPRISIGVRHARVSGLTLMRDFSSE